MITRDPQSWFTKGKTKTVMNNHSPTFNQQFQFRLDAPATFPLHLEVRDDDTIGSDPLGQTLVALGDHPSIVATCELELPPQVRAAKLGRL